MRFMKIFLCVALIFFAAIMNGCGSSNEEAADDANKSAPPAADQAPPQEEPAPAPVDVNATAVDALSEDNHWIKDRNSGAYLWNPEPQDGESVTWSGDVVREGNNLYAQGRGTLTWYKDGQIIQTDEGTFERGKHHGQFRHTFPSGNVIYSNWNHGEEIAEPHLDYSDRRTYSDTPDNVADARRAFINYHRAITDGNYRAAYETLSIAQRQRRGDYNSFVNGFANTLSSEVSDIDLVYADGDSCTFDYRLTARDRYGNRIKTQVFRGQVTMAKDKGRWYVRNAKSNKVDEWYE